MLKTFVFYTNYHKPVHNGECDNRYARKQGNCNTEKQDGLVVKNASKIRVIALAAAPHSPHL